MEIHYSSEDLRLGSDDVDCLQAIVCSLNKVYPLEGEVQLIITDDIFIRELNAKYRGKDITTDVLSFPLVGSCPQHINALSALVGEIYISLPRALNQALLLSVPFFTEMARLFIHGYLHLAGWTHDTCKDLVAMEQETDRYLTQMGLLPEKIRS